MPAMCEVCKVSIPLRNALCSECAQDVRRSQGRAITLTAKNGANGLSVTAWVGDDYRGEKLFIGYDKKEALRIARQQVEEEGGLGLYRGVIEGI